MKYKNYNITEAPYLHMERWIATHENYCGCPDCSDVVISADTIKDLKQAIDDYIIEQEDVRNMFNSMMGTPIEHFNKLKIRDQNND